MLLQQQQKNATDGAFQLSTFLCVFVSCFTTQMICSIMLIDGQISFYFILFFWSRSGESAAVCAIIFRISLYSQLAVYFRNHIHIVTETKKKIKNKRIINNNCHPSNQWDCEFGIPGPDIDADTWHAVSKLAKFLSISTHFGTRATEIEKKNWASSYDSVAIALKHDNRIENRKIGAKNPNVKSFNL